MRRREFICIPLGAALCLLIKGCGGSGSQQRIQPPDIILSDDEDPQKLAKRLSGLYSKLEQLSNDTSRCLRIGFKCGGRMDVLRLHFRDPENGVADYKHVRIVRESTDEAIRLIWGREKRHCPDRQIRQRWWGGAQGQQRERDGVQGQGLDGGISNEAN